jgi:hypothetical protein
LVVFVKLPIIEVEPLSEVAKDVVNPAGEFRVHLKLVPDKLLLVPNVIPVKDKSEHISCEEGVAVANGTGSIKTVDEIGVPRQ